MHKMKSVFNVNECNGWECQDWLKTILYCLASGDNCCIDRCYEFLDFLEGLHFGYHIDGDLQKSLEGYVQDFLDGEFN